MRRRALLARISQTAAGRGVSCRLVRQGRRHEIWEVDGFRFAVPRHREINEWTAEAVMRDLEPILGEGWWR